MKKSIYLLLASCTLIISCIPSLHPIYDESSRITDDRIIGEWANSLDGLELKNIRYKTENKGRVDINSLKVESDDDGLNLETAGYWHFDRAADIRYVKKGKGKRSTSISLESQMMNSPDSSLLAKGYTVESINQLPYYILEYRDLTSDDAGTDKLIVNLTRIGGHLYMDFAPLPDIKEATRFSVNNIAAHTFARIEFNDGKMRIRSFDSEYIEELIRNKRVRLKHEVIDESIVLTASTAELRAFIEKYGDKEELYYDEEYLIAL